MKNWTENVNAGQQAFVNKLEEIKKQYAFV
jgi:hypothetical protein